MLGAAIMALVCAIVLVCVVGGAPAAALALLPLAFASIAASGIRR
jgi:hypothetical protein